MLPQSKSLAHSHAVYDRALAQPQCAPPDPLQVRVRPGQMLGVRYSSGPYDLKVPGLAAARLSVNLTSAQVYGALEGDRPREHVANRHSMFLTPAGAGARWRKDVSTDHINLYFEPGAMDEPDRGVGRLISGDGALLNVTVPGSVGLIQALDDELKLGDEFSPEAVDSLGRLLLVALARGHRQALRSTDEALSAKAMRRVADFVDANLTQRLLVQELAAVAELPPDVFASSFLRRTGRTPHQFVLSRRLARATALLRAGGLSITEVALAAGFSSQSHLTRLMRQRLGLAPAQWLADESARRGRSSAPD